MKSYYRVMLGRGSSLFKDCLEGGFIGADFGFTQDFTNELTDNKNQFIEKFGPEWLERSPGKSKISAGLSAGYTWRISIGINEGDIILSPDGKGSYIVGEVTGPYKFHAGGPLPHRRAVKWSDCNFGRNEMSPALRNSTGSAGTVSNVTKHAEEIENLILGKPLSKIENSEESEELDSEKQLDYAVHTYLGKKMDGLYEQLENERLKDLLNQINKLKIEHPETTLHLARKSAEMMCKNLFKELLKQDPGTRMLNQLIQELDKAQCLPRLVIVHLFTILGYGNFGSHDQGEESHAVRTEFITPCLLAYIWCLDWYIFAGYA